jgi:hypothetical protein
LFTLAALPACGSSETQPAAHSDAGAGGAASGPTFTRVMREVMTNGRCGGPLCHSSNVAGVHLGSKDTLYNSLVNKPAEGAKCRAGATGSEAGVASGDGGVQNYTIVVPGKPEESLLYLKIDHNPPCGDPMPVGGTLTDAQITLVHDWIAAGANND